MEVDRFFNGYGRLTLILMRKRHCFVFIQEREDAEDAVKELKGRKVRGENISLELLEKGKKTSYGEFPRYILKVENISQVAGIWCWKESDRETLAKMNCNEVS